MAEHVHRLQQLAKGDADPHIQQLRTQYTELVQGFNNYVEGYNHNIKVFTDTLAELDSKIGAIALVVDDLVKDGVAGVTRLTELDAGENTEAVGKVHWLAYITHYTQQVRAEVDRAKAAAVEVQKAPEVQFDPLITPPAIEPEEEEETVSVVFGGDSDGQDSPGYATSP